jgi:hypothetical protein
LTGGNNKQQATQQRPIDQAPSTSMIQWQPKHVSSDRHTLQSLHFSATHRHGVLEEFNPLQFPLIQRGC